MNNTPHWTRLVLAALAVPQIVTGLWAVIAPAHWFDSFPGFGPMLVAAEPPFNAHLASDAGSGFLATGIFAILAAAWGDRRLVIAAAAGLLAFALPHFIYHATHPAEALSTTTNTVNVVLLLAAAIIPAAVALAAYTRKELT